MGVVNQVAPTARSAGPEATECLHRDQRPVVLNAIRHPYMRRWSEELLGTEDGCWTLARTDGTEMVADTIGRCTPAVVVVDAVDFPACCHTALNSLPPERVIVVGPEPDPAYRSAAVSLGAGGWVSRDHLGEELAAAVRTALGCPRDRCPEGTAASPTAKRASGAATGTAAKPHQISGVGGTCR